jgi:hypothetical protein
MFTRYANGQTVKEISDELKSREIFSNMRYKYTSKSSFHNLLKNRRYIGEYRFADIVTPGGMPVIVPTEIFDRVQKRMEENKHKPAAMKANEEYILTTKLFCGKCGAMMVDTFVNAVFLHDDKLVLTFNWQDGTKHYR